MKKFSFALVFAALLSAAIPAGAEINTSAEAVILYEPVTGTAVYEKNADERLPIASITKIMTALIAIERCSPEETVTIPKICEYVEGSSLYLKEGEEYTMSALLYGLMLESGNDAAVAIACHTAGSVENFVSLMNQRAEQLNCVNTHFDNPHGLDSEGHYSTARDIAIITAEAMKNHYFEMIVSTKQITVDGHSYRNHNKLLWSCEGVTGVKTGYTMASGRTLVSSCERDGTRFICVTLSDKDDWEDHAALYDCAFSSWKLYCTPETGTAVAEVPVVSGAAETVTAVPVSSAFLLVPADSVPELEILTPMFVYAEVRERSYAGLLRVKINGEAIFTSELQFTCGVALDENQRLSFWERLLGQ